MTNREDAGAARELLQSSEKLRSDLMAAVGKLDSYIEQLKAVIPSTEAGGDEQAVT